MLNDLTLAGRLAKDIEMSYLQSDMAVAKTSLAINEKNKDKDYTTFIDLRIFGKTAEIANQYLAKGRMVLVKGKLKIDDYVDSKGEKKKATYCLVEKIIFLDSNNNNSQKSDNIKQKIEKNTQNQDDIDEKYVYIKEDDKELPF